MKQPLFIKPVLQEKIWGGTKLRDIYGYDIPSETTGECWAISAYKNGMGYISSPEKYAGISLQELFEKEPALFAHPSVTEFPLLTKIIDAKEDLSVQVHPDDAYGKSHAGELGKTECWYVISADPGAKIIFGHTAKTREEFSQAIEEGKWSELLVEVPVKAGDFFYVPSGTVHAIGAGVMVLETQQSSDTTYRLYDYDRPDANGQLRELHIQESIDVTTIPHQVEQPVYEPVQQESSVLTPLIRSDYFNVAHWDVDGVLTLSHEKTYTLVSVLEGEGVIKTEEGEWHLKKGIHFIIPATLTEWTFEGNMTVIVATPGPKNS
ncbi:mannose-6-phosphate isomerase, class I [Vagococcus lutrae]|uniref:mannose-6-phosphate isomerase, class I n=1 Tax=Vagococcus lutrae TaxID=81947 RepID=UPI002890538D|nr:mannose-6-phosphate isomerase, class I [Vagococcus lutrae]MDT2801841.1 mannose-6-phosphate isomerase, class I [Vagococcus lutrae]MDT2826189.1 mannose-6-phosphate isomerase, class I [Vagococcus lutrae]